MKKVKPSLTDILQTSSGRKYLASKDIRFFAKYYLRHYITTSIPKGGLHDQWAQYIMADDNVILACPREHGKSTWFSLIYPLWAILFKKHTFIVIISDTHTQASSLLGGIVAELETNEFILEDFGKIAGFVPKAAEEKQKWTTSDIVTLTGVRVVALGSSAKFRGIRHKESRPSLIIIDDLENDEGVVNIEQREKLANLFRKSIMNLGTIGTRFAMVGTILHFDSLLINLINSPPPGWKTKLYRAIADSKAIWPEHWSLENLEQRKGEIGTIAFESEFMNNPLDPTTQILKPTVFYTGDMNMPEWRCFTYVDLAISEKETADYVAMVTAARHKQTGKIRMIDPVRMRGDITKQLEFMFNYYARHRHLVFGIESVAYQKAFAQILKLESNKRGIYIPVQEVEVDKDKVRRALEVSVHIENGTVEFSANHQDYLAELIQFPKASHDDWVDATVGAIRLAIRGSGDSVLRSGGEVSYPKNY